MGKSRIGPMVVVAGLVLASSLVSTPGFSAGRVWQDIVEAAIAPTGVRLIQPTRLRAVEIDLEALQAVLAAAPDESTSLADRPLLRLPMPGGELSFRVAIAPVMEPGLARKFPGMRAYLGVVEGQPHITGRFNIGPRGFRAMIFTPDGTVFIDPIFRGDTRHYQVYRTADLPASRRPPDRVVPRTAPNRGPVRGSSGSGLLGSAERSIGGNLITYRVAIATTGEYSEFHDPPTGPTDLPDKTIVMDELLVVTNRVSGVYERDLGVRLTLVANNDLVVFQSPAADPYENSDGTSMLAANTGVVSGLIGPNAYDIGHVVSTGGGGVAFLGVVCFDAQKGGGVTGLPTPINDAFYIDYVAHEMGHQFGGNHTFNGDEGACAGGNRNAGTAYEPGSGVTVMAYAGICGSQNTANNSIDVFHPASFAEIVAYTRDSDGNTCGIITGNSNRPPVAIVPAGGFTIPKSTPFELTGSGTDPDGDPLTYQWDQYDLGPAGAPNAGAISTTAPLFRSFLPGTSPTRTFPQRSDLINGTQTLGEILPTVARTLKFRLTVRDNRHAPDGGGVSSADLSFNVAASAGPFRLTFPNYANDFQAGQLMPVTWNVAGTDAAPVSCAAVDILLSTDGALTFPIVLASGVPNDGAEVVTLPDVDTQAAHIKVKCSNNVFFDISRARFTIAKEAPALQVGGGYENPDTDGSYTLNWTRPALASGPDTLLQSSACGPVFVDDAEEPLVGGSNSRWTGSAQWVSQPKPSDNSMAYYIPSGAAQNESLTMIDAIAIPAGGSSVLSFFSRESFENGYDYGQVRVSSDGGATFTTLASYTGPGRLNPNTNFEQGTRSIDLSQYAGKSIKIRFRVLSDEYSAEVTTGWYIDNIQLTATPYSEVATVPGQSYTFAGQPVGTYCHRVRTTYQIDGVPEPSPSSNVVNITVATTNLLPQAALASDRQSGQAPLTVNFDASGSSDPDGDTPLSYHFDFGDGSDPVVQAGPTVQHVYSGVGDYTATVVVTDARGAVSAPGAEVPIEVLEDVAEVGPFVFVERTGVATGVFITSEAKTMSGGFTDALPVSIDNGGQISINGGAYASGGSILDGQTLRVRHVSAAGAGQEKISTVTVGAYSTPFRSVTSSDDRVPDAFSFGSKLGQVGGSVVESDPIHLGGYNTDAPIQPGPGIEYSLDVGASWSSGAGVLAAPVTPCDLCLSAAIRVRHTASSTARGYPKTYLRIGGVTGYFTTRTQ